MIKFALSLARSRLLVIGLEMLLGPTFLRICVDAKYRSIILVHLQVQILYCSLMGGSALENLCWSS